MKLVKNTRASTTHCFTLLFLFILLSSSFATHAQTGLPSAAAALAAAQRADGYWITNNSLGNAGWANAAYYTGNQRALRLLSGTNFLNRSLQWAAANNWIIGPEAGTTSDANAECSGQSYIDLYRMDPQSNRIVSIKGKLDALVATNRVDQWWWIDALYMAGPAFAKYGNLTGDTNYFQKMFLMYSDTKTRIPLFDPSSGLWYRDTNNIYPKAMTSSGKKVFWSRGNGWVIAAMTRIIEQLPTNAPQRAEFITMFQTMAAALKPLQGADGMWRSSLLEPTQFPNPETSGSSFFTYAMAWGVRNGFLNAADYTNSIALGWYGLTNLALQPSGLVGYVQGVGSAPANPGVNDQASYGVGAFLMACSEVALLAPDAPTVSPWAGGDAVIVDQNFDGQESVTLDGSATEVYWGPAKSFTWWTNGVQLATGITAQVTLPLGTNIVTLQVVGSDNVTYTDTVAKTVIQLPPIIANAGVTAYIRDIDQNGEEPVPLDATGTQVLGGSALSYDWWLGNIWLTNGITAQPTLPLGRYVITLRVLGSNGQTYTNNVTKYVVPFPNVSAIGNQVGNVPTNTIDGDLTTRWSQMGLAQWIQYDLGQPEQITAVHAAIYQGDSRNAYFDIRVSNDAASWTLVSSNSSSGTTSNLVRYAFAMPQTDRYVRITGYGNSGSTWNSFTEIAVESQLTLVDNNSNGIPDAWEIARLGNTNDAIGHDSDGDGLTDLQEYIAGTNPTNALDVLTLQCSPATNGGVNLNFLARAAVGPGYLGLNRYHALEQSPTLQPGSWQTISGWDNVIGDNLSKTYNLAPTNNQQLFRLRTWLAP